MTAHTPTPPELRPSEAPSSEAPRQRAAEHPSAPWARALAWIVVAALVVAAGLYAFLTLVRVPGEVARGSAEAVHELVSVAEAFRRGTVTTLFLSHATAVSGSSYLQFAKVEQVEVFERKDEASVLWGQLRLPDLVVRARAPVEYTYYLDLEGEWHFQLENHRIVAVVPPIRYNKPSIDASEIEYSVAAGSLLRDEDEALARLKEGLTQLAWQRAADNVDLVRELGRRKVEEFVSTWLAPSFADGEEYSVEVIFADEQPDVEIGQAPGE